MIEFPILMESRRDLAIVLKSLIYEERHRIVTALTEQSGLISALARNSVQSRRFGGTLEPFTASEWLFVQKPGTELARLEEASIRRSFEGLRVDFERLSLASVLSELILRVAPRQEACPELFRLHSNALAYLEEKAGEAGGVGGSVTAEDIALLNAYLTKLLQWSGSQPRLGACMGCGIAIDGVGPEASLTCIVADAGWMCPECRIRETRHVRERQGQGFHHSQIRLTPVAIRDFHLCLSVPIRQVPTRIEASRAEHQELFRFLEALFVYHIPGFDRTPLRSLRFVDLSPT